MPSQGRGTSPPKQKNLPPRHPNPQEQLRGDTKPSLILCIFEISEDFCPAREAGYWERCRIREEDGEDGLNTAKCRIRRRCWRAAPTPKAMGRSKCEVLTWHQQGKRLGKGHQMRQEAESRLIFINKM